ncbi:Hpt domain-containing protein [Aestuariibacter sp. A3R04]|uniref:Hpt domain-containing protein n=1 Tax=Aestuariibacter sp. A3R04 TaxID=2841571 RepID=UPI001C08E93B|nr:Hpt domain-containing protein [Aestuariibacter sp. A3R04]MBU3022338.1 Hpt domain-containing protein [Aestuariibacter sp. A3R04]
MDSSDTLIDLKFGLSQLSGNSELFLRLLQKFSDEYVTAEDKLSLFFNQHNWDSARTYLHTIKGVAGNLGITKLHHASRQAENELKSASEPPASFHLFCDTLRATLTYIQTLQASPVLLNGDIPAEQADESELQRSSETTAPDDFIRALAQNEFIAQEQLDAWLAVSTPDSGKQQQIRDAIDDLDYDNALALLKN